MKTTRRRASRGYSLTELLTVVAIVGLVVLVSVPAFTQLMPQYRLRSAASDITGALRMIRQKAITTRSDWKMTLDPVNDRYSLSEKDTTGAWIKIGSNGRPVIGDGAWWTALGGVDVTGASTFEVTMQRDGTAESAATIVLATNSSRVKWNRYTITVAASGSVTVTPSKV